MKRQSYGISRKQESQLTNNSQIKNKVQIQNKNNLKIKQNFKSITKARPKRCALCRKMIPVESYNKHYQCCYRFDQKNNEIQAPKEQKKFEYKIRKDQVNKQKNSNFRIKKVISIQQKNPKIQQQIITEKNSENKNLTEVNKQILSPKQKQFEEKQELPSNLKNSQVNNQQQKNLSINNYQYNLNIEDESIQQPNQPTNIQRNRILQQYESSSSDDDEYPINQQISNHITQNIPHHQQLISNNTNNNDIYNQSLINNNPITSLVINMAQIEAIINRTILRQNQTIKSMLQQLRHLNLIASQIQDISQLRITSQITGIFAHRIRELQSSIINQIGQVILINLQSSFSFANFISEFCPPQIQLGFSQEEIDIRFPQMTNFNSQNINCSICLNDIKKKQKKIQLYCNHEFHPDCIIKWLRKKTTCPVCRADQK